MGALDVLCPFICAVEAMPDWFAVQYLRQMAFAAHRLPLFWILLPEVIGGGQQRSTVYMGVQYPARQSHASDPPMCLELLYTEGAQTRPSQNGYGVPTS